MSKTVTAVYGPTHWSREMTVLLIEMYEAHPVLYDVKHEQYKNRHARAVALDQLTAALLDKCKTIRAIDVKNKIHSLRSQFTCELRRIMGSETALSEEDRTEPYWLQKLSFLKDHVTTVKSGNRVSYSTIKSEVHPSKKKEPQWFEIKESRSSIEDYSNEGDSIDSYIEYTPAPKKNRTEPAPEDPLGGVGTTLLSSIQGVLNNATSAKNTSEFSVEINTFGEYIKGQLSSITNPDRQADLQHLLSNAIYEFKCSLRESN